MTFLLPLLALVLSQPATAPATRPAVATLEFRLVAGPGDDDAEVVPAPGEPGGELRLLRDVPLDASHVESVRRDQDDRGLPAARLTFTDDGARRMGDLTGDNVGRRLAVVLDGEVLTAPTINARITRTAVLIGGRGGIDPDTLARLRDVVGRR